MAAIDASQYAEITIESTVDRSKTVDIRLGVVSIDYYEDIFSPTVTAKMIVINTGNALQGDDPNQTQSLYHGLPLRGGERVSLRIEGNSDNNPGLDFSSDPSLYMYVSNISNIVSEGEKESFVLSLTTREAITNETSRVGEKYPSSSTLSSSAEKIIREKILTPRRINVDPTQNKYGFIGNLRKPFTVLTWMASRGVPDISEKDATAGYVFYQTATSYNFRSIDKLMKEPPKATYIYSTGAPNNVGSGEDFKILKYITNKNQNLVENLRLGTYSSQRFFFNPLTFTINDPVQGIFNSQNYSGKVVNLGKDIRIPSLNETADKSIADFPTRIISQFLDVGTLEKGVERDATNSDPAKYQSQTSMRYNTLMTQSMTMTIPSNTSLEAGNIIECVFPKTTIGKKREDDVEQSGLYMIKELCHHFDTENSFTSLKLVRDTYGKSTTV